MAGRWEEEEREGSCIYLRVISGTLLWKYWWSSAPGRLECSEHRATARGLETARDGDCELSSRVIQFFHQYLCTILKHYYLVFKCSLSTRHWDIFNSLLWSIIYSRQERVKCMFVIVCFRISMFQLENTTPLCSRANITVVSSPDILLQLYCKFWILFVFQFPERWSSKGCCKNQACGVMLYRN